MKPQPQPPPPQPTDATYRWLTAFIHGVNDTARKLEMRRGIDRLCAECRNRSQRISG